VCESGGMSERVATIVAASIMSGCWSLVSGTILVVGLAVFGSPIG
jgi:hypothetical protein